MAALFRGLRAGRALRGLGMVVAQPAATRPQYNNLRRGFHRTVLRLQDESKPTSSSSEPTATPASSSSPPSFHQHYQAHPAGEETAATSAEATAHPVEDVTTASPEVSAHPAEEDTASASPEATAEPAGEDTTTASHEAAASETDTTETEAASQSNTSYQDLGGEEDEEYETEEELQARVLTAALEFVPLHGWSMEAIAAGAETLGLSSASTGMYNNGAGDLVLHFIAQCNSQLTNILAEQHNQVQLGKAEPKETAQFLRDAVETRLRMVIPYIDKWPQAMSILLLPHNIPDSLKHLSTLMDDIWYYAGDRSTDLNWYTKRAALTGIYNTTELVMLQDSSPDFENTWTFLDNRIQDVVNMAGTAKQVQATGEAVAQGLMGAAVTLKNLTGLNQKR